MSRGNEKGRDEFRTRLGFIVACIGSAVGMGNIWMFPYRTGKFGGAAFLIPYFIFVILLGFFRRDRGDGVWQEHEDRAFGGLFQCDGDAVLEKRERSGGRLSG